MESDNKSKNNHIEMGVILLCVGVTIFLATFFYFNVVMAIMKCILYLFVLVMAGAAISEFGEAINKNKTARRIKSTTLFTLKKIIFPVVLYGFTIRYYYAIFKDGINSFDSPISGILFAVLLAIICILYFWIFIRKSTKSIHK